MGCWWRALRAAGSLAPPSSQAGGGPRAIAAYMGEALAPFDFGAVRLVKPVPHVLGLAGDRGRRTQGAELIEVGPAHTPGDVIVWIPDAKVAIAADILFIGVTPIMWAGPLESWVAALERLPRARRRALRPRSRPGLRARRGRAPDRLLALARPVRRPSASTPALSPADTRARARARRGDRRARLRRVARTRAGADQRRARSTRTAAAPRARRARAS